MRQIILDPLVEQIAKCIERHKLETGSYARWLWGENRNLGRNEYGCADAMNLLNFFIRLSFLA